MKSRIFKDSYRKAQLAGKALSKYEVPELVGYYIAKGSKWKDFLLNDINELNISSVRGYAALRILETL